MLMHEKEIGELTGRIRAEFLEMPGLALTRWQMQRLWLLDDSRCNAVVETLVESGFLRRRRNDTYSRADNAV